MSRRRYRRLRLSPRFHRRPRLPLLLAVLVVAANLPDVDFLFAPLVIAGGWVVVRVVDDGPGELDARAEAVAAHPRIFAGGVFAEPVPAKHVVLGTRDVGRGDDREERGEHEAHARPQDHQPVGPVAHPGEQVGHRDGRRVACRLTVVLVAVAGGAGGPGSGGAGSHAHDEKVVDAEYTEVKDKK